MLKNLKSLLKCLAQVICFKPEYLCQFVYKQYLWLLKKTVVIGQRHIFKFLFSFFKFVFVFSTLASAVQVSIELWDGVLGQSVSMVTVGHPRSAEAEAADGARVCTV